ncbi:histamine H2 receptor [Heterodontus francisci]|uniref:histamine H2 receptor n=1 Tax=Heterodontus francisci TaxID=7792 RepID=UPI00355BD89B
MLSITVLYACLMILTCVGSITANILLLFILGSNEKLQKDTSVLIFNLCICDLILGLIVIPVGAHNILFDGDCYGRQDPWCQFFAFLYVLLQLASVHSMTWVTIDKFAEICLPLHYVQLFTRRRAWVTTFSVWIYCILNASLPFVGLGQYTYEEHRYICAPSFNSSLKAYCVVTIAIGVFTPIMIVCCLAIYIVHIARYQAFRGNFECNDQHCYSVPAKYYLRSTILLVSAAFNNLIAPHNIHFKSTKRFTEEKPFGNNSWINRNKTDSLDGLAALLVFLLICWAPYITISVYETFGGKTPPFAEMLATWLAFLTSALNPWTNSVTQKKFRNAMCEGWGNMKRRFLHKEEYSLSSVKEANVNLRSQEILRASRLITEGQAALLAVTCAAFLIDIIEENPVGRAASLRKISINLLLAPNK